MANKQQWNIKDFVSQRVDVRWESEVDGKTQVKWYPATLIELFDDDRAEVSLDNFDENGTSTVEVSVKQVKPPRKAKEPKKMEAKQPLPPPPAPGGKSYADLLKPPPAPKPEPVAAAPVAAAAAKPAAGAFDYEKFTAYVKKLHPGFAAAVYRPTDEQLERVKTTAFTNHFNDRKAERYASTLQELSRSLNSTQDCFMYNETRYMFYLPTTQEIDRQDGWDVKVNNKNAVAEGSYITFNTDFTRVFDVNDRVKGERKAQSATPVNIVVQEAALAPADRPRATLVERARSAINHWNEYAARENAKKADDKRVIHYTEEAVHLLSQAFERVFPLNTIAMISTTTTCIFAGDLSATITCIRNAPRYADYVKTAGNHQKGGNNNNNNNGKGGNNQGKRKPTEAAAIAAGENGARKQHKDQKEKGQQKKRHSNQKGGNNGGGAKNLEKILD
jgi:hypothetical protein